MNVVIRSFIGALFFSLCGCGSFLPEQNASSHALASQGKTDYVIVQSKGATEAEIFAAKELRSFLGKVTGADFKQIAEDDAIPTGKAIYLGQTKYAKAQGVNFGEYGDEEWCIRADAKGSLIIGGGRPRGTLYGAYEFLEKHAGCHWLDETTEMTPQKNSLEIPSTLNIRDKPAFRIRAMVTYFPANRKEAFQLFQARNKSNLFPHDDPKHSYMDANLGFNRLYGKPNFCHTFYAYSKDWPDRPEYFSFNGAVRLRAENSSGPGQVCLSNPDVRKLFKRKLREFIREDKVEAAELGYPAPRIYDISCNDNENKCVCTECMKMAERYGAYSGLMLDFTNDIADDIRQDYPDIQIQTFAYTFTEKPPTGISAHGNVTVRIALLGPEFYKERDTVRSLLHGNNQESLKLIKDWAKVAKNLSIWDYWIIYGEEFASPYANVSSIQPNIKIYLENGMKDIFIENENPEKSSFFGLKRWLGLKMMQNPNQQAEPLIDIFMEGYYGRAASIMKEYLGYLERRMGEVPEKMASVPTARRKYLDMDFFAHVENLFDKAEELLTDSPESLAHVKQERVPVDAALLHKWGIFQKQSPAILGTAFDKSAVTCRYQKSVFAAIEHYIPPNRWKELKSQKTEQIKSLELSVPLPDDFKDKECVDLFWPSFKANSRYGMEIVADKDATGGKAAKLGSAHQKTHAPDFHKLPVEVGIYNDLTRKEDSHLKMDVSALHVDGKYHLYKIGRCSIGAKSYLWVHWSWILQQFLTRAYNPLFPDDVYDVYASLKVQGPAYAPGSKEENAIFMDRIILVKIDLR